MKISEVVKLLAAGFKAEEIRGFISEENTPEPLQTPPDVEVPEKESEEAPADQEAAEEVDYKALYEKAQADLKAAQAANRDMAKSEGIDTEERQKRIRAIFGTE